MFAYYTEKMSAVFLVAHPNGIHDPADSPVPG